MQRGIAALLQSLMPQSLRLFRLAGVLAFALPLGVIGCGGDSSGGDDAAVALIKTYDCQECHSPSDNVADLSGGTKDLKASYGKHAFGPNLTPDSKTGLGSWSDAQIKAAILQGKDDDGSLLCDVMPIFGTPCEPSSQNCQGPMSDSDADTLVAYLKGLKAVSHDVTETTCK